MSEYSYERCLQKSYRVNWRIEEVLEGRAFDPGKEWLPRGLSAAADLTFLDEAERRKLTHVEMAAYAHLFGYVEEFIAPTVVEQAMAVGEDERAAFDALLNFAAEEVKHMNLFREVRGLIDTAIGFDLALLPGAQETADLVRSKSTAAILLLTACIEWMTQRHFRECFQQDVSLDPFTAHIFKRHWEEECQHAQMDHLETLRAFGDLTEAERDQAIEDLIELVAALDGLLRQQARLDLDNFRRYVGRPLTNAESIQILDHLLAAKRHTFLVTGITHDRFQDLFSRVTTPAQQDRVNKALVSLLPVLAAA